MSYAIDAATRLHHRQVEAATQVQDLVLKAFGGLATLADKAPQPPARFAAPLEKVAAPVASIVGTPREFADYLGRARHDWSDLRTRFQVAIADLKIAQPEAEETIEPEVGIAPEARTATAKRKPRAKAKAAKATRA